MAVRCRHSVAPDRVLFEGRKEGALPSVVGLEETTSELNPKPTVDLRANGLNGCWVKQSRTWRSGAGMVQHVLLDATKQDPSRCDSYHSPMKVQKLTCVFFISGLWTGDGRSSERDQSTRLV